MKRKALELIQQPMGPDLCSPMCFLGEDTEKMTIKGGDQKVASLPLQNIKVAKGATPEPDWHFCYQQANLVDSGGPNFSTRPVSGTYTWRSWGNLWFFPGWEMEQFLCRSLPNLLKIKIVYLVQSVLVHFLEQNKVNGY